MEVPLTERFYGIVSSLLMVSKDFAENILMKTKQPNFSNSSFEKKLLYIGRILPPIILTVIFRMGTLSLAFHRLFVFQEFVLVIPLMFSIVLPPTICLIALKSSSTTIRKLSVSECIFGVMGEMSSFSIWGKLKQVDSRWIQLWFIIYFNLIYSTFCLYEAIYPTRVYTDWYAIAFFFCGWLAVSMYMKQVFYLDQEEDEMEDSKDKEESNLNHPKDELDNRQEREEYYIFDQSGKIIGETKSVRLKGLQRAKREKLIQIMIYS